MTIAKNTKRAKAIIAGAYDIRCYSLRNNFSGEPLNEHPVVWADLVEGAENRYRKLVKVSQPEFLARELNGYHVKLTAGEKSGYYTIHVHSNLWYTFHSAVQS